MSNKVVYMRSGFRVLKRVKYMFSVIDPTIQRTSKNHDTEREIIETVTFLSVQSAEKLLYDASDADLQRSPYYYLEIIKKVLQAYV